jgi:hypothetical protein
MNTGDPRCVPCPQVGRTSPNLASDRQPGPHPGGRLRFDPSISERLPEAAMKLYMHPVSMTSRPVMLFMAENNIAAEQQVIDLMTGEHHKEPYCSINPSRLVPMLEDGDFRLTESSAILKYLADKIGSPA